MGEETNEPLNEKELFDELNGKLGNSLIELYEPENKVVGRDDVIHKLKIRMNRKRTKVACLVGLPGAGKTAIVETYKKINQEQNRDVQLMSLSVGSLAAHGETKLNERLENMLPWLEEYEDNLRKIRPNVEIVLFVDEIHLIVSIYGKGTKKGGDLLKRALGRPSIRFIGATTTNEYESYIASDGAFARRLRKIPVDEIDKSTTKMVLNDFLETYMPESIQELNKNTINDSLFEKVIKANRMYRPEFAEPDKSLDIFETAISISELEGIPIDDAMINRIFKDDYNITLDFKANFDKIYNSIINRVIGQPMALYMVEGSVKKLTFNIGFNEAPTSLFFIGPSGVGKTEMTKAFAEGLHDDPDKYIHLDMSDYSLPTSEPAFRYNLGKKAKNTNTKIILLDELEKANKLIHQTLLPILQEGVFQYTTTGADGFPVDNKVSLKNFVIICTSNVAAELFKDIHKFNKKGKPISGNNINEYTVELKQEFQNLEADIHSALRSRFAPELIGRFANIIPFYALHEATYIQIAERTTMKLLKALNNRPESYKIDIQAPVDWSQNGYKYKTSEVIMYIVFELANVSDSNFGGARAITRYIDNDLYMEILDAIFKYPDKRRFIVRTNGLSGFEGIGNVQGKGALVVKPAV